MLSQDDVKQIKKQLLQQIDSTFPEDKKDIAKQQINSMNDEQLIEFLKKNELLKEISDSPSETQQSIFRLIIDKKIPSYEIFEDKNLLVVLEINPVSKGHSLVIPKKATQFSQEIPKEFLEIGNKIADKIKERLKPKEVQLASSNLFGESILNIIPIYNDEKIDSKRYKAEESELKSVQEELKKPSEKPVEKKIIPKEKPKPKEIYKLPKRIP